MNGLEQIFVSNISAVVVTGIFIFYLEKKDRRSKETYDVFNQTINNHLDHSTQVIRDNNTIIREASVAFQELCDSIKALNGKKKKK